MIKLILYTLTIGVIFSGANCTKPNNLPIGYYSAFVGTNGSITTFHSAEILAPPLSKVTHNIRSTYGPALVVNRSDGLLYLAYFPEGTSNLLHIMSAKNNETWSTPVVVSLATSGRSAPTMANLSKTDFVIAWNAGGKLIAGIYDVSEKDIRVIMEDIEPSWGDIRNAPSVTAKGDSVFMVWRGENAVIASFGRYNEHQGTVLWNFSFELPYADYIADDHPVVASDSYDFYYSYMTRIDQQHLANVSLVSNALSMWSSKDGVAWTLSYQCYAPVTLPGPKGITVRRFGQQGHQAEVIWLTASPTDSNEKGGQIIQASPYPSSIEFCRTSNWSSIFNISAKEGTKPAIVYNLVY